MIIFFFNRTTQPSYRTNLFVCHHCKQPGHIKNQCPSLLVGYSTYPMKQHRSVVSPFSSDFQLLLNKRNLYFYLQQSSSGGNLSNSSSSTGGDGTQNTNSGPMRSSVAHGSHIVTRHAPYQMPYHHRGNRTHRGAGHPRGEPLPKKTTGIPRDRLIPVPKHIPGAFRDQNGASVVPRQIA